MFLSISSIHFSFIYTKTLKANVDLFGRWCFITSFQISCNTKKNFTRNVIVLTTFSQTIFSSKIYPFPYTKSHFYVVKSILHFFVFHSPLFNVFFCISCYVQNFYYILGGSRLFVDSFFHF